MSRNSKSRRDAKKKKTGPARAVGAARLAASILAQLQIDGAIFAAMKRADGEWSLLVGGATAASAPDPQTIVGIMQAMAYEAESNGSIAAVQCSAQLQPLLGGPASEIEEDRWEALARKILATFPLPVRS